MDYESEVLARYVSGAALRRNGNGPADSPIQTAPLDGAEILDAIFAFLGRFVAYPSHAAQVAHTLWIAHTHLMDVWESTPRIAFLSPEPGSGKTRALEITGLLVPNPVEAVNVTPAYLFRKVGDDNAKPTILFDEIDTVFGPKAKENEEIRGLLNAGHRRGAVAGRCVLRGKKVETEEIPAYSAVALAGLNDLPDTLMSRSVLIRMRRRAPDERVEPFRMRIHGEQAVPIRAQLVAWALQIKETVKWPEMPSGIVDRNADIWEPLLCVANAAGGDWPARGNVSAVSLVSLSQDAKRQTMGIQLLTDIHGIFGNLESFFSEDLVRKLLENEESPWGDLRGKPLDTRGLARRLNDYEIKPIQIRIGTKSAKGYRRGSFHDAWKRYLPLSLSGSETTETSETNEPK